VFPKGPVNFTRYIQIIYNSKANQEQPVSNPDYNHNINNRNDEKLYVFSLKDIFHDIIGLKGEVF